ncbi:hypothetical protein EYF80_042334 [Liparis tanakae]|uniref:Uncharacterized protein n=1 Tax=Liparis tanakae TaxID=230148 RepID=A0A4Z2G1P4_9TELE|nr:hypothetical protein EYF80_042334 [Liparis tanakae]
MGQVRMKTTTHTSAQVPFTSLLLSRVMVLMGWQIPRYLWTHRHRRPRTTTGLQPEGSPRGRSYLPVHGDAGEEEDGAVEVEVEEEADEAAHEVAEDPAVPQHVTRHQEGQRQAVHEVGGGQVHHVDQRGVPAPPAAAAAAAVMAAGAQQHHRVEGEAEDEGQRVADRQEDVLDDGGRDEAGEPPEALGWSLTAAKPASGEEMWLNPMASRGGGFYRGRKDSAPSGLVPQRPQSARHFLFQPGGGGRYLSGDMR